jgi:Ca-activated chloride channel family protein
MRLITLACCAAAMLVASSAADQTQTFRSRIDMVVVYPLVSGPDGRLVTDLRAEDFTVVDNGAPAQIDTFSSDRQPITAALLLDMSASMEDRWTGVRDSALKFVDALEPIDRLRIGSFGAEVAMSPHLTNDKKVLARVLSEELWPGSSTPLWRAIGAGMQSLAAETGRRTIAVVTDGLDTSNASHFAVVDRAIKEQFMLYAVGFEGKGLGPRLVDLIGQTGGGYFDLKRKDDLGVAFLRVAEELRHQYLIGFTPASLDGRTHSLQVRVNKPGFRARAPLQFVAPLRKDAAR